MEFIIFLILMLVINYFTQLLMLKFNSDLFYDLYVHECYAFKKFRKVYKKEVKK